MIINCKSEEFRDRPFRARVFVDGKEVQQVWYCDTELGIVKTYDLEDGGRILAGFGLSPELRERGEKEGWDMPLDGAVSRTVRGLVEIRDVKPWNVVTDATE